MVNEIKIRDKLLLFILNNKDYFSVDLVMKDDQSSTPIIKLKDKENTFMIKLAIKEARAKRIKESNKSETASIWEEFEEAASKVIINQI